MRGATIEDSETDATVTVRARATVLAAGIWSADLEALAGVEPPIAMRASKGVHVLVPRDRLALEDALIVRAERSVLLVIPWGEHWLIGTTDTPWTLDRDHRAASAADIDYLLDHVNPLLRDPLTRADVTGVFAGLRPLVDDDAGDTAKLSREHVVRTPRAGLVTVTGGKYTTYLAAEAVYAVTHEGELRLDDVLTRRTRISIEASDRGAAAAPAVAALMAPLLGWDDARTAAEVERYRARLDAERAAERSPSDREAASARRRVRDPRTVQRR